MLSFIIKHKLECIMVLVICILIGILSMYLSLVNQISDLQDDVRVLIKGHYDIQCDTYYDNGYIFSRCSMEDYNTLLDNLYE